MFKGYPLHTNLGDASHSCVCSIFKLNKMNRIDILRTLYFLKILCEVKFQFDLSVCLSACPPDTCPHWRPRPSHRSMWGGGLQDLEDCFTICRGRPPVYLYKYKGKQPIPYNCLLLEWVNECLVALPAPFNVSKWHCKHFKILYYNSLCDLMDWKWNKIYTYDGLYRVKDYDLEVEG